MGTAVETDTRQTAGREAEPKIRDRRWIALAVLCASVVVLAVDNTILNVALPSIGQDLGATTSQLQWIVDAYILIFAGLLLTGGALGDRFGRKGALLAGLVVFGAGSVAAALGTTPTAVMAARGAMGVGGALVMPATLSLITNLFTDPKERARAIAVWAGTWGLGIIIGPVAGGWLLEHFWWGSAFLVNVPVIVLALVGTALVVPTSRDEHAPRLDPVGALLSVVGLGTLVWAIIEAPTHGWTDPVTLTGFAVASLTLAAFVGWELRREQPMLDMRFFRNPRFSAASTAVTITFFALIGATFLLTQHLQLVLGYSALEAGLRITPIALGLILMAQVATRLVERVGTKVVVSAGLATIAGGLFIASRIQPGDGYGYVLASLLVIGTGMGLTMAPATESIMGSVPAAKAGVGSAVNDTTREIGGALGVAVLGSVASSAYGSAMAEQIAAAPVAVPAQAADAIQDSLYGALAVAEQVGGPLGQGLADSARTAFVDAMSTSLTAGAVLVLVSAAIALAFLPSRAAAGDEALSDDRGGSGEEGGSADRAGAEALEPAQEPEVREPVAA